MPEDGKKSHDKKKNDPKEQRKPRQRHQQVAAEKKVQKKPDESKTAPQVAQKPVYEPPPPEFYKNLKRETDEILKITEEENAKYKKKEIQSNWTKYEMPIETYEEMEEQENIGADYEKLIQASHSIGGHFQFKHEKSWDTNTAPSLYDKYFEINMDDLYLSLCTIPFYQRNDIEESLFNEHDLLSMNNRTVRYKQKYFNDKSISSTELDAEDKILSSMREKEKHNDDRFENLVIKDGSKIETIPKNEHENELNIRPLDTEVINSVSNIDSEIKEITQQLNEANLKCEKDIVDDIKIDKLHNISASEDRKLLDETKIRPETEMTSNKTYENKPNDNILKEINEDDDFIFGNTKQAEVETVVSNTTKSAVQTDEQRQDSKNPVIESPEDLEKWLDDFLDG